MKRRSIKRGVRIVSSTVAGALLLVPFATANSSPRPAAPEFRILPGISKLHPTLLDTDDLRHVLMRPLERLHQANYRVYGKLVRVDANGVRTSYNVSFKVRGFPNALRVFFEVTAPASARANMLLVTHPDGQTSIQIAHPGDSKPTTLPFDQWSQGPLGPGFSYEDFLEAQFFWHNQTLLQTTKYGARECDILKSTPAANTPTHYAEVRTWLDRTIGFPVYVEKTLKGSGAVKEYTYYGLRQSSGVWSATQVEEKVRGSAGSTLLIFDHGTANAKLDGREFDPVQLTRF
jgi:hypothetical protein